MLKILNSQSIRLLIIIGALSLLVYSSPADVEFFRLIRLISGITFLFFVPGYYFSRALFEVHRPAEKFGLSLILGLLLQILNVLMLYTFSSLFVYEQTDFGLIIIFLTLFWILVLRIFPAYCGHFSSNKNKSPPARKVLRICFGESMLVFCIFLMAVILNLYTQSFSFHAMTDAALYCEMARNLVRTGRFTSKVTDYLPLFFFNKLGFSTHPFTYFIIALFFLIGGVSFSSAKLMAVFLGSLMIFPVYGLAHELFDKKTAIIASFITALHPFVVFFSSTLYSGSEILSALFVITGLYFFLLGMKNSEVKYMITSGLLLFAVAGSWWPNFIAMLGSIFMICALYDIHTDLSKVRVWKRIFLTLLLLVSLFFSAILFFMRPDFYININMSISLWIIFVSIPLLFIFILIEQRKDQRVFIVSLTVITIYIAQLFYWFRTFILTEYIRSAGLLTPTWPLLSAYMPLLGLPNTLNDLWSRFSCYWQLINNSLTLVLIAISFLAFINMPKWKQNLLVFSFPFSYSVLTIILLAPFYPLGYIVPELWNYRFIVAIAPFFIILSASTLGQLIQIVPLHKKNIRRITVKKRIKALSFIFILSIMIVNFFPHYGEGIYFLTRVDMDLFYWKPGIEWIKNNTSSDDVLMTRKPREWAWYTDRICVIPEPDNITINDLVALIRTFKVNYLIVDKLFYESFHNLKYLYLNASVSPFDLVFSYPSPIYNANLLIYNVTQLNTILYESKI